MKQVVKMASIATTIALASATCSVAASDFVTPKGEEIIDQNVVKIIDPITWSAVGAFILDEAKSAVLGEIKSFFKNAIFGSSGPQYVMLHDQALQQIENIVTEVILNSDVEDAKSALYSFQDMIAYYHDSAQDDAPDYTVLPILLNYATTLKNHQAYRSNYNPNAHLLTGSFALISSLSMAVYVEQQLKGDVSHGYVKGVANNLHSTLTSLGGQANNYISNGITISYPSGNCSNIIIRSQDTSSKSDNLNGSKFAEDAAAINGPGYEQTDSARWGNQCYFHVWDRIGNKARTYHIADYGQTLAGNLAHNYYNGLISQYKDQIKGEYYDSIVSDLANY